MMMARIRRDNRVAHVKETAAVAALTVVIVGLFAVVFLYLLPAAIDHELARAAAAAQQVQRSASR